MRKYGTHNSHNDYLKDAIARSKKNLKKYEVGSERYFIITDHIKRLEWQMKGGGLTIWERQKMTNNYYETGGITHDL